MEKILQIFWITGIVASELSFDLRVRGADQTAAAISEVVKSVFAVKAAPFDIISYGQNFNFERIISKIVSKNLDVDHQIIKFSGEKKFNREIYNSAILFFDSFKSLQSFMSDARLRDILTSRPLQLLIFCSKLTAKQFASLKFGAKNQFLSFFIEEKRVFSLKSIRSFGPQRCRATELITINKFFKKSMKWNTREFFLKPDRNFHRCPFLFGVQKILLRSTYKSFNDAKGVKRYHFKGYNVKIFDTIADALNFSIIYFPFEDKDSKHEENPDAVVNTVTINAVNKSKHFVTQPFIYEKLMFLIPPGESYTSFEKMFLAFELDVWILIVITFALVFIVILILNFTPKHIRNIVVGSRVTTPSLNVAIAFFGLGQMVLPRRSFARFLLMMFIMYSLIIRTAYQGKSFEILQKDVRRAEVQTIAEMFGKNFSVYAYASVFSQWKRNDLLDR